MNKNKKGFTLAELLIVVAIIAVLVAISIPVFTNQLEKAREAVDLENVRSAYSIIQTSFMTGEAPDGKEWPDEGALIYFYTNSGTFQRFELGVTTANAYKLKSNGVELPDFIQIDRYGWKECLIMVTYGEDNFQMYTSPAP